MNFMNNIRRISGLAFFFGGLAFLKFSQLEPFCGSSCFNILRGFTFMEIDQNTHTHTHTHRRTLTYTHTYIDCKDAKKCGLCFKSVLNQFYLTFIL